MIEILKNYKMRIYTFIISVCFALIAIFCHMDVLFKVIAWILAVINFPFIRMLMAYIWTVVLSFFNISGIIFEIVIVWILNGIGSILIALLGNVSIWLMVVLLIYGFGRFIWLIKTFIKK